ncbi:MAG: type IV secretory system conjugative DNA transfer family protein [Vulcanimicrobiaceae bacterium]
MLIAAFAGAKINNRFPKDFGAAVEHNDWASLNDLVNAKLLAHNQPGIFIGSIEPPKLFGIIKRPLEPLVDANPSHVVEDAASRSGKDVGQITPTLARTWPQSAVVNDNKGEQHLLTSGVRAAYFGNTIHRIAFQSGKVGDRIAFPDGTYAEEQWGSSKHNILDEVPWGQDGEYTALLQVMTTLVCKELKQLEGEDGHWYRTSRVLGTILGYKVKYDPLETLRSIPRVAMLLAGDVEGINEEIAAMKQGMATDGAEVDSIHAVIEHYLGWSATGQGTRPAWLHRAEDAQRERVAAILANKRREIGVSLSEADYERFEREEKKRLRASIAKMNEAMVHPDLERAVRNTMRIRGDEAGSVYSTINSQLTPWLDPRVIDNTRTSTMTFWGLVNSEHPETVYVVNPPQYGDMFRPLYRVWYETLLRTLTSEMKQDVATKAMVSPNKHPILFIWNEPMTIGEIPALEHILPFCASNGMRHLFPYQLSSQRTVQFGEHEPITGNCFTHIVHAPNDAKEQKIISDALGKRLVAQESESQTFMQNPNKTVSPGSIPLLSPIEVAQIPNDPIFETRRDRTGKLVLKTNSEGALHVKRQAHQIITMRTGIAYARKVQWFTDEFMDLYRSIKRYATVPPSSSEVVFSHTPSLIDERQADQRHAEEVPAKPVSTPEVILEPMQLDGHAGDDAIIVIRRDEPTTQLPPAFGEILGDNS